MTCHVINYILEVHDDSNLVERLYFYQFLLQFKSQPIPPFSFDKIKPHRYHLETYSLDEHLSCLLSYSLNVDIFTCAHVCEFEKIVCALFQNIYSFCRYLRNSTPQNYEHYEDCQYNQYKERR